MSHVRRQHRRNYCIAGQAHVLTFSCYHRFRFLLADRTCQWLADAIEAARREHDFALWAYVFMPEHAHLLVYPRRSGYDSNIDNPRTLMSEVDYFHLNPVGRTLAARAEDWKWSSAGWYLGKATNSLMPDTIPPEWIA